MLLKNKNAIIYGAGGSIGGSVARAFACEGANLFLCGRRLPSLEVVATEIRAAGGFAETAIVDALDESAVEDHADAIFKKAGSIDISFNAIGLEDAQGKPIVEMLPDDFTRPVQIAMKTQFITSKAAGRHMIRSRSGVILSISATPAGKAYQLVGGFGPACCAIEGFSRNLAAELGQYGIRVICMRSAGSPDSAVFMDALEQRGSLAEMEIGAIVRDTMLQRLPLMAEIANVAVFLVSERASGITGTAVNVTCGTTRD